MALRELAEETGVTDAKILPCGPGNIYSLEVLTVDGHVKRGAYVSSHLHLNVTYVAQANPNEAVRVKPDENNDVAWVPLDEVISRSSEPWMCEHVYKKLIAKVKLI